MLSILLAISICVFALTACNTKVDYQNVAQFKQALNEGKNVDGKTVVITVDTLVPDSAFGYNIQTGEHLNFCSSKNPNVSEGDTLTVKVKSVDSFLGSYIISYEIVKK